MILKHQNIVNLNNNFLCAICFSLNWVYHNCIFLKHIFWNALQYIVYKSHAVKPPSSFLSSYCFPFSISCLISPDVPFPFLKWLYVLKFCSSLAPILLLILKSMNLSQYSGLGKGQSYFSACLGPLWRGTSCEVRHPWKVWL